MERKGLKTVFFYLPHEIHKQLKESAVKNDTSIKQLVMGLIQQHLYTEHNENLRNQHE